MIIKNVDFYFLKWHREELAGNESKIQMDYKTRVELKKNTREHIQDIAIEPDNGYEIMLLETLWRKNNFSVY